MDNVKKLIGARIRELRLKKNLSQEKFSEMISLDRRSVSNIECGNTFPSTSLLKIAVALNVELKELFDFDYLNNSDEQLLAKITSKLATLNSEQLKIVYRLTEIL